MGLLALHASARADSVHMLLLSLSRSAGNRLLSPFCGSYDVSTRWTCEETDCQGSNDQIVATGGLRSCSLSESSGSDVRGDSSLEHDEAVLWSSSSSV